MAARNLESAANRAKELNDKGFNVKTVYNDAYERDTCVSMIDEVVENEGRIDILVNNFGTSDPKVDKDTKSTEYDEFIKIIDVNIGSVFIASQKAVKHMSKTGGGSIINSSSIGGLIPDIS